MSFLLLKLQLYWWESLKKKATRISKKQWASACLFFAYPEFTFEKTQVSVHQRLQQLHHGIDCGHLEIDLRRPVILRTNLLLHVKSLGTLVGF